jgi:hypothetical protein
MHAAPKDQQSEFLSRLTEGLDRSRQYESDLVSRCVEAAKTGDNATSLDEADIFRLSAQLLKTRYPEQAHALDKAALAYFAAFNHMPRRFPQTVSDGLVRDLPRFRQQMENALAGLKSW